MIPSTHAEIEQVYIAAELAGCNSICITSCQSGEGVTTLAMALTERYLLAGYRVMFLDLNLNHPSFRELELFDADEEQWIEHTSSMRCFTGLPSPTNSQTKLTYKNPNNLKLQIKHWLDTYDRIVIDTSPLLNINRGNIPAQIVASACDYAVLSVLSCATTKHQITKAITMLSDNRVQLLGTILNSRDQPSLPEELCRQINRLFFLPATWRRHIKHKIKQNRFLSIPI